MSTTGYVPPADYTATQHEGTPSLAIKNTFPRRLMTLIALKTYAHFYSHDGPCISISKSLIVKKGPFVHLTEAATMQFVAANNSIPLCGAFEELLSQRPGKLSAADLSDIFAQLRRIFQILRTLVPPDGVGVQSCLGGSLRDSRIPRSRPRFGPFKTIQDFHRWLPEDLEPDNHPDRFKGQLWKEIKEMVIKQDGLWPQPVFTHGDLNPFNILVRDDQVVGIIDWEFAGWHPCYWEYTSTWYGNRIWQGRQKLLTKFLDAYPTDLEMEKTRQRWWGDF
ncbi:hypothetical protein FOYG_14340 [Fusarium oxysporum NRRL 32931]|uniref:Aminoglycoside phosphotransferase domain-containing protein n=1 Tax=Fusarium oxysporum NRRL 32931 TaxID=660029 RepID=W9HMK0_FUSOX|nr:hypothetical protein FOYG_14340 [Fusarium oxysporum NRRL 32931]